MYSGSHEELYGMLQDRRVDVVFNDQCKFYLMIMKAVDR